MHTFYDVTIQKTNKGIHWTITVGNKAEKMDSEQNYLRI